jgi:hypothetical protein
MTCIALMDFVSGKVHHLGYAGSAKVNVQKTHLNMTYSFNIKSNGMAEICVCIVQPNVKN